MRDNPKQPPLAQRGVVTEVVVPIVVPIVSAGTTAATTVVVQKLLTRPEKKD